MQINFNTEVNITLSNYDYKFLSLSAANNNGYEMEKKYFWQENVSKILLISWKPKRNSDTRGSISKSWIFLAQ
jgi:hypothetical protein